MTESPIALVVDDDETLRMMVQAQLKRLGLKSDLARTGREAVKLATSKRYDLILMDIQMPEMDGFEATVAIRNASSAREPIVAMTASQERARALSSGMDDFLFKPFLMDDLRKIVHRWVTH